MIEWLADETTPAGRSRSQAVGLVVVFASRAPQSLTAIKEFFAAEQLDIDAALPAERGTQRELYFRVSAGRKVRHFARRHNGSLFDRHRHFRGISPKAKPLFRLALTPRFTGT